MLSVWESNGGLTALRQDQLRLQWDLITLVHIFLSFIVVLFRLVAALLGFGQSLRTASSK